MARQVPAKNGGTLTRPDKGETMNPNGRPRKYISELRAQGYKLSEVNDCIQVLMSMNVEELAAVLQNPSATVLEKTVAAAIKKGIEKGSLFSIETLLSRVYGKPKETSTVTNDGRIEVVFIDGRTIL